MSNQVPLLVPSAAVRWEPSLAIKVDALWKEPPSAGFSAP